MTEKSLHKRIQEMANIVSDSALSGANLGLNLSMHRTSLINGQQERLQRFLDAGIDKDTALEAMRANLYLDDYDLINLLRPAHTITPENFSLEVSEQDTINRILLERDIKVDGK